MDSDELKIILEKHLEKALDNDSKIIVASNLIVSDANKKLADVNTELAKTTRESAELLAKTTKISAEYLKKNTELSVRMMKGLTITLIAVGSVQIVIALVQLLFKHS